MRAMRAALLSVRSVRALPVLARAPSRLVSTEAAAEGSTASKPIRAVVARSTTFIKEMTPTATFLGILVSLTSVGVLFYSRITKLEADMMGVAGKLEERITGSEKTLQERVTGSEKTLKSDMAGLKETIKSDMAGTASTLQERVAGIEKAADLKVRSRSAPDLRARSNPLAHPPTPPPLQYKTK